MKARLAAFALLTFAATLHAAPTSTPTPTPAPVAPSVEKAPADFPLTLRGFFGKGDTTEISVQEKISGKSVWLSPGASRTGWKLESADAAGGRAVFSKGNRRVVVFTGGEAPVSSWKALKSITDSVVIQKLAELMKDRKCRELLGAVTEEARETVRKKFPEYFNKPSEPEEEYPDNIIVAMSLEKKRLLLDRTGPEAEALQAVVIPLCDAEVCEIPPDPTLKGAGSAAGEDKPGSGESDATLRIYELADQLYRQRTGGK